MKRIHVLAMLIVLLTAMPVLAQTAGMLSFQGVLKDSNGNLMNGPVELEFRIFDAQTGGTLVAGPFGPLAATVERGVVTVPFGSVSATACDGTPRWVAIDLNGSALPRLELSPSIGTPLPGQGNTSIEIDTGRNVTIHGGMEVHGGYADEARPGLKIHKHSDLTYPNNTALVVIGGVTDLAAKVFRIFTGGGDPWHLRGLFEGYLEVDQGALTVNGEYGATSVPALKIWKHSDYNYPNNTILELVGGVTDIAPRRFRIFTADGDPYRLRASFDGTFTVNGTAVSHVLQITGGSDLAEPFSVRKSADQGETVEPGMVVVIDPDNPGQLRLATGAYDRKVAGIISGAKGLSPGMVMQADGTSSGGSEQPVALTGRVYVWADASYGAIEPGDMLTTSATAGHAMKASDPSQSFGAVIGKAMEPLAEGRGLILVLVNLQ